MADQSLDRLRPLCMALPEVTEKESHGAPTWFIREKRTFAMFVDNHHNDGRIAVWAAAPPGAKEALIASDPERFFNPPYVGTRGWVGIRLEEGVDWQEVADLLAEGYESVAAKLGKKKA
ncbi:MmcQ/YjbR family DNA-binding protein [bacterium]|nr:MAG: MmcQ/YjbR family DNA-binding protein [bacterium]